MTNTENQANCYVILGASGDIGSLVARQLRHSGRNVFLASRPSERLDQLAKELEAPKFEVDATDIAAVQECFVQAASESGPIAGAVNCVGSVLLKPAHITRDTEWYDTLNINLTSAFATVRGAAKTMTEQGGSVVLISSAAGRIGLASHEAIAAAKAGIIGLAQSAAATYAGKQLRFNVVAPGLVKTKLTKKIWESPRAAATSTSMHALQRMGDAEDVASMITWLLDPANNWVTGEVFSVDGGLSNVRLHAPSK